MKPPLIAIDGPAGAGKSTTSKAVALRLGIPYLDTGALYRGATYAVIKRGVDVSHPAAVVRVVAGLKFTILDSEIGTRLWIDDQEVTEYLRSPEVTRAVNAVCEVSEVRRRLVDLQREWALRGFGVIEGRDIGTVVLPEAGLKVFMTARPEIRALRRGRDLNITDPQALSKLAAELAERDRRDTERTESPLRKAEDALFLDTSDMTFTEQVNQIVRWAAERFEIKLYEARRL